MTQLDPASLDRAAAFVVSSLGQRPAVTVVVERGALSPEDLLESPSPVWQVEQPHGANLPCRLQCGRVGSVPVLVIVEVPPYLPVRQRPCPVGIAAYCGCDWVLLVAHATPVEPERHTGELVLVEDHVNLLGDSPLLPAKPSEVAYFLDMSVAYDPALRETMLRASDSVQVPIGVGVLVASPLAQRPDTIAIESLRQNGGDICGTGIVPHVLEAKRLGCRVLAVCVLGPKAADGSHRSPSSGADPLPAARLPELLRAAIKDASGWILTDSGPREVRSPAQPEEYG
ncbi:MAG: hypothetical protein KJ060_11115 [Candidatus Hydrogenedentes bacterium]|nr:hypothetical protein [Candidatus Hydrogenedentota bacterium]